MGSYFKPLRRKVGVATLVVACVLMTAWVRKSVNRTFYFSVELQDHGIEFSVANRHHQAGRGWGYENLMQLSIPYWSVVIPLTVSSAYLLLAKSKSVSGPKVIDISSQEV